MPLGTAWVESPVGPAAKGLHLWAEGHKGLEARAASVGFLELEWPPHLSSWQPCLAKEMKDVQVRSPDQGGGILVNLHICLCPPQLRGESGSKASTWWGRGGWGASSAAAASWHCLAMSDKLVGKIRVRQGGNMGKSMHKSTWARFLLQVPRCQQLLWTRLPLTLAITNVLQAT